MKKKKTWREDFREGGSLVGGFAKLTYELDGKVKKEKVKFVGKFWHIKELDRNENDPYFKGVIFDLYNNEMGSVEWTEKEFYSNCISFSDLF